MLTYEIPSSLEPEIDELEALIQDFKSDKIDANELKAHRVPFGVYEQRKDDSYMVRIRCAGGIITPSQLAKVAEIADQYGKSTIHLTTRQEVQIHDVVLDDVIPILRELRQEGLSSRGGGGNTIRNIMTDVYSGIHPDELFDVTPYAVALTTQLISEKDSWRLPRKYKIAFSSSAADRGLATINDLGFIAAIQDGREGFTAYIAGGMGARSEIGKVLYDFVLPEEIYPIAKGLKNLFDKNGNRRNKHDARIRFLWNNLGEEKFREILEQEIDLVKKNSNIKLEWPVVEDSAQYISGTSINPDSDYKAWLARFVQPQKQKGLNAILIPVPLGNLPNVTARDWGGFLTKFGDNVIRISQDQNFVVRNISDQSLPELYHFVQQHFPQSAQPAVLSTLRACAGASTCKLGIGLSRGLASAINAELEDSHLDLDELQGFRVNISGCPNSCGQHMIAHLGYFGKASRKDSHLYSAYNVVVGGRVEQGHSQYGQVAGSVAARDIPDFHRRVMEHYLLEKESYEGIDQYLDGSGRKYITSLLEEYQNIPSFEKDKNYYFDWGSDRQFSLEGRGVGECSAGIFDLIDVDVANIERVRKELKLETDSEKLNSLHYQLVLYSSRMLLVTQGIEAKRDTEVFDKYLETFINPCLVEGKFKTLIHSARDRDYKTIDPRQAQDLSETMVELYQNMDNSLNFHVQAAAVSDKQLATKDGRKFKDLRGVACPMNFVKVKIELASMQKGQVLEVWLDDGQPIANVPGSVKSEGHKILSQDKIKDYWGLSIQKS